MWRDVNEAPPRLPLRQQSIFSLSIAKKLRDLHQPLASGGNLARIEAKALLDWIETHRGEHDSRKDAVHGLDPGA
jgi:hypothetical protein